MAATRWLVASLDPRGWPIRWQLTALNVGVHAATLVILSAIFLAQLDGAMVGLTADNMRDKSRAVTEERRPPPDESGPPYAEPGRPPQPVPLQRAAFLAIRRLSGPESGVLIFDLNGSLVEATQTYEDQEAWPLPPPGWLDQQAARSGRPLIVRQETRRTLLMAVPLPAPDGTIIGTLVLARSLELIDAVQARLLWLLLAGVAIAVAVGGGLSLRATREALRPLDRVIAAARAIESGKLGVRLRPTKRDEIGELGVAFDTMLDRLAGMVASQRQFVADAAHELRTPLTSLGGMVEVLQMGADRGDPSTIRRMLDTMGREIDRLGRLVADLLTLSRLDAEQPLHLADVNLGVLLEDVATQTDLLAHGQQIATDAPEPVVVTADPDRLKQVLLNLTANALRFTTPDGRITLRLRTDDGRAVMEVADTGSGIAPDLLPRVTDRFVRGDVSRARATGGSGLGLAIASAIVEAHGGTLTIASTVGQGTTVTISLPLPPPTPGDGRGRTTAAPETAGQPHAPHSAHGPEAAVSGAPTRTGR